MGILGKKNTKNEEVELNIDEEDKKVEEFYREETNSVNKALERMKIQQEDKQKESQDQKDKVEFITIRSRILQQYTSPTTGYKGVTANKEEEQEVEDRARMEMRDRKKAAIPKG